MNKFVKGILITQSIVLSILLFSIINTNSHLFADNAYGFSLIFASDPQFCFYDNCEGKDTNQFDSIQELALNPEMIDAKKFEGIVINGNHTNTNDNWERDLFKNYISGLENILPEVWFGMGNNDLYGLDKGHQDIPRKLRGSNMIKDMITEINTSKGVVFKDYNINKYYKFPWRRMKYEGSFSYAWDIDTNNANSRFIQLNNFPTYKADWTVFENGKINYIKIKESLDWLEDVLKASTHKNVYINMHDIWFKGDDVGKQRFINILKKFANIRAIFVGHSQQVGLRDYIDLGEYRVPVFHNGSTINNNYMAVNFGQDSLEVYHIDSSRGSVNITSTQVMNFFDMIVKTR